MLNRHNLLIGTIIFITFQLSSCNDDDEASILGTWTCSHGYFENCNEAVFNSEPTCDGFSVTFFKDGTYASRAEYEDQTYEQEGTYIVSGEFLILNLESGNEATDRFVLSSDELHITQEQGDDCQLIWVYTK